MIKVAAGVILKDNKILIAQKREGERLGLKWEFPGGKVLELNQYDFAPADIPIALEVKKRLQSSTGKT